MPKVNFWSVNWGSYNSNKGNYNYINDHYINVKVNMGLFKNSQMGVNYIAD